MKVKRIISIDLLGFQPTEIEFDDFTAVLCFNEDHTSYGSECDCYCHRTYTRVSKCREKMIWFYLKRGDHQTKPEFLTRVLVKRDADCTRGLHPEWGCCTGKLHIKFEKEDDDSIFLAFGFTMFDIKIENDKIFMTPRYGCPGI
ncbi:MAG: hypothetical protein WCI36_04260 [bacterium]